MIVPGVKWFLHTCALSVGVVWPVSQPSELLDRYLSWERSACKFWNHRCCTRRSVQLLIFKHCLSYRLAAHLRPAIVLSLCQAQWVITMALFGCCVARHLASDTKRIPVKAIIWERHIFKFLFVAVCVLIYITFSFEFVCLLCSCFSPFQRFTRQHCLQVIGAVMKMRSLTWNLLLTIWGWIQTFTSLETRYHTLPLLVLYSIATCSYEFVWFIAQCSALQHGFRKTCTGVPWVWRVPWRFPVF